MSFCPNSRHRGPVGHFAFCTNVHHAACERIRRPEGSVKNWKFWNNDTNQRHNIFPKQTLRKQISVSVTRRKARHWDNLTLSNNLKQSNTLTYPNSPGTKLKIISLYRAGAWKEFRIRLVEAEGISQSWIYGDATLNFVKYNRDTWDPAESLHLDLSSVVKLVSHVFRFQLFGPRFPARNQNRWFKTETPKEPLSFSHWCTWRKLRETQKHSNSR